MSGEGSSISYIQGKGSAVKWFYCYWVKKQIEPISHSPSPPINLCNEIS